VLYKFLFLPISLLRPQKNFNTKCDCKWKWKWEFRGDNLFQIPSIFLSSTANLAMQSPSIAISTGWFPIREINFRVEETTVLRYKIYVAQPTTFPLSATASLQICRCWLQSLCICLMWITFLTSTQDGKQKVTFSIETCDKNILLFVYFCLQQKSNWKSERTSRVNQPREGPAPWTANIIIYLWDPESLVYVWDLGGQIWNGGWITTIIFVTFLIFWYIAIRCY